MQVLKRILLSIVLLGAAALTLLLSDLHSREGGRPSETAAQAKIPVAILKHASNFLLDEVEQGLLKKLEAAGYKDGGRITLQRFSAEGDLPTANAMAQRLADGSFKMAITISTLSLQCMANANKAGRTIHVFGGVTDPSGSGVGIQQMGSTNKPPWLTGIGTFQPVELIFREAKKLWPGLKVVGVVWNPAERNSEVCTLKARQVCRELGMELLEATVDQSKDVREAADSLVSRGAQAFWTGADVTVMNASAALCEAALKGKVPVFSNTSGQVRQGTLFDLGANYFEVGQRIGEIASDVLGGGNPATMVVTNFMPERIMLNKQVLKKMRDPWRFTDDIMARAELILGEDGRVEKDASRSVAAAPAAVPAGRTFKIGLVYFGPDEGTDSAIAGMMDGLRKLGLVEGRNLTVRKFHANGEIGSIAAVLQSLDGSDVDVIVPFSTPVITAACAGVHHKPVVFTYCSDPVAAGTGRSFEDHLPFVTGIGSFPPVEDAIVLLKRMFPKLQRLGAVYNNAEANSVKIVAVLRETCKRNSIQLIEAVANNTGEVVQAAQSLGVRGVEAVYLPADNTAYQAFDGLVGRLTTMKIPMVIDAPEFGHRGALAVVGVGYYESGAAVAEPLLRVLKGESPAKIPIRNVTNKKVILNQDVARKLGFHFPPEVLAMQTVAAAPAVAAGTAPSKTWVIQQVSYIESVMVEDAMHGMLDGLKEAGLREGMDFKLKTLSAQGDMAALGLLYDSARTAGVDVYVVYGTPTLQVAMQKVRDTPIVFTVLANPFVIGAGKTDTDHLPNITGIYTQGPYPEMAEMLQTHFPQLKHVGTLYCPAEVNSVFNKDIFVREAARRGITVEAVAANTASDLPDAAMALCGRHLDAVVQVADNLSIGGFPTIARAAAQARLPVFACVGDAARHGASVVFARDYYDAGHDTAFKVAQVIRGESPAQIPFMKLTKVQKLVNLKNAQACRLAIPEALLRESKQVTDSTQP